MIREIKRFIRNSIFWRYALRAKIAFSYFRIPLGRAISWIPLNTETDNFYYPLTESNVRTLASTIAVVTNQAPTLIESYLLEIIENQDFISKLRNFFQNDLSMRDSKLGLGRRIGWYAIVRAMKPKLVVETGVHHGVGGSIICEALTRNAQEGFMGKYLGTDYDNNAGRLVQTYNPTTGTILYGDSILSLESIFDEIDVFINDSDHSAEYEAREYAVISRKLSSTGIILGDNAHVTTELLEFSLRHSRKFLFFSEVPDNHWYPGGGIGISFK